MEKTGYQTKARKIIRKYLMEHKDTGVSVAEIYQYLQDNDTKTSITTVYRYLDKLEAEGTVFRYMDEAGEKAVFQYVSEKGHCHEHLHLKCVCCGKVEHLDCAFMDEIREHIARDHGFTVKCDKSVLYGYCQKCQKNK